MNKFKNVTNKIIYWAPTKFIIISIAFFLLSQKYINIINPIVNGSWFVSGYYTGLQLLAAFIIAAITIAVTFKNNKFLLTFILIIVFAGIGIMASCTTYKFCSSGPCATIDSTPSPVQSYSPTPIPLPTSTPDVTHEPVEKDPLEISTIAEMTKGIKNKLKSNNSTNPTINIGVKYDDLTLKAKRKEDALLSKGKNTYEEWNEVLDLRINALEFNKNRTIYFLIANTYVKMAECVQNNEKKRKLYENAIENFENSLNSWNAFENDVTVSEFLGNYGDALSRLNKSPEIKSLNNDYKAVALFEMSCDYKLNDSRCLSAAQKYYELGEDRNDKDSYKYYLNAEKMLNKITKGDFANGKRPFLECYKQVYFALQIYIDNYKVIDPMKDKVTYENFYNNCIERLNLIQKETN